MTQANSEIGTEVMDGSSQVSVGDFPDTSPQTNFDIFIDNHPELDALRRKYSIFGKEGSKLNRELARVARYSGELIYSQAEICGSGYLGQPRID